MQKDVLNSKVGRIHLLTRCYMQLLCYLNNNIYGEFIDSLTSTIGDLSYNDFWCDLSYDSIELEKQAVIKEIGFEQSALADDFISIDIKSGDLDKNLGELWFDSLVILCEFTSHRSQFLNRAVDVFIENRQAFAGTEHQHLIGMLIEAQMMNKVEYFAKALGFECFIPSNQEIEQDLLRASLELNRVYSGGKSKGRQKSKDLPN